MKHQLRWLSMALFLFGLMVFARPGNVEERIAGVLSDPHRSEADKARDVTSKPTEILTFFGLKEGMVVADIFGGGGYYSELIAGGVGSKGKVYLHNNQAYLGYIGKEIDKRTTGDRLKNVTQLRTETKDMQLPEGKLDMVVIVLGYHDLFYSGQGWPKIDQKNFMEQIRKALKPGGVLGIVDHCARAGSGHTHSQTLHRVDKDFVKTDIAEHGFVFQAETDILFNKEDDHTLGVFDPKVRRKTDRFVYRFTKK